MNRIILIALLSILSVSFTFSQNYEWVNVPQVSFNAPAGITKQVFTPGGSASTNFYSLSIKDNGSNFKFWIHSFDVFTNIWTPVDSATVNDPFQEVFIDQSSFQTNFGFATTSNNLHFFQFDGFSLFQAANMDAGQLITDFTTDDGSLLYISTYNGNTTSVELFDYSQSLSMGTFPLPMNLNWTATSIQYNMFDNLLYVAEQTLNSGHIHTMDNLGNTNAIFGTPEVPDFNNGMVPIEVAPNGKFELFITSHDHPSLVYEDISNTFIEVPLSSANINQTFTLLPDPYDEIDISNSQTEMHIVGLNTTPEMLTFKRTLPSSVIDPTYPGVTPNAGSPVSDISISQLDGSVRQMVCYYDNSSTNYIIKISNNIPQVTSFHIPQLCNGVDGAQLLIDSIFVNDPDFDFNGITPVSSSDQSVVTSAGLTVQYDLAGDFYYITTDSLRLGGNTTINVTLDDQFGQHSYDFNVTLDSVSTSTINVSACNSYTVPSGDETYTSSGVYNDTLLSNAGCDSILIINLDMNFPQPNTLEVIECETYTSPSGLYTWTSSGTYYDTLFGGATNGCDSTLTINLTINNSSPNSIAETACVEYVSPSGLYTWTSSGTYYDTLVGAAANGCDSTLTIALTINNPATNFFNLTVCDQFTPPSNSTTWFATGVYDDTLFGMAANGCDSIITYDLTIFYTETENLTITACDSYTGPSGTNTWTTSGTYSDVVVGATANGCDSIYNIDLTIINSQPSTISETVCETYTSPSGLYTWTTSGTYNDTLFGGAANGCDSTLTIALTVNNSQPSTIAETACIEYVSPSGLYTWNTSGTYFDTLVGAAANGCDSTLTIALTINNPSLATISRTICDTYTSPSGLYTWTTSGVYNDTLFGGAANGCDSILTINLTINNSTPVNFNSTDYSFCTNGELLNLANETGVSGGYYQIGYVTLSQNAFFDPATYDISQGTTNTIDFTYINNSGCISTASANANFFLPADISLSVIDASCGGNNGEVTASIVNNNNTFTSFWNTGDIDVTSISNLTPGSYYLEVEDDKGCVSVAHATVQATDITITETITPTSCFGLADGSIDMTIVGAGGPFIYLWSNGTSQEDALNLPKGMHSVTVWNSNGCAVTKDFYVDGPASENIISTTANADCGVSNGNIFVASPTNLVTPLNFSWDNGVTNLNNLNVPTGTYTLTITDANGCTANHTASVGSNSGVSVVANITPTDCNLTNGSISIFENVNSPDTIASILWDNGMTTNTISGLDAGTYTSTVTTASGCNTVNTWTVGIAQPDQNPICIVSVDSLTTTNLVVWEKVQTVGISHYNIYRETAAAGFYELIDTVDFDNISVFNDVVASPAVNSWRYKISAVNDCDIEGPLSLHHKTIHLVYTFDSGQGNIFFDDYEGIVYSSVDLFRYSNENGWELIQTLPAGQYTYVDMTISGLTGIDYMAEVAPGSVCTATTGKAQDYNSSRSNKAAGIFNPGNGTGDSNNSIIEVSNEVFGATLFPNPTHGNFNIEINHTGIENLNYSIIDLKGTVLESGNLVNGMNELNISDLSNGMYIVKIFNSTTAETVRVVKN